MPATVNVDGLADYRLKAAKLTALKKIGASDAVPAKSRQRSAISSIATMSSPVFCREVHPSLAAHDK